MIHSYDTILTKELKEQIIFDYTDNFLSINKIQKKYDIKSYVYVRKLIGDKIRTINEASKIAHQKYKDKFKHTEETKKKLSLKQKEYIKTHIEEFSERLKRKISYPEQIFINFLKKYGYDEKFLIEREYSIYPYFIDFAFVDIKLAIEIDGSQHLRADRIESDKKKDKLLIDNGWKVLRFSENIVKTNWVLIDEKIQEFVENKEIAYEKIGIIKTPKKLNDQKNKKVQKTIKYGCLSDSVFSEKEVQSYIQNRKVERPSKDILAEEIQKYPFTFLGEKYGVSDKCICKWCKFYGLPSTKYELKGFKEQPMLPILKCSFCGKEFKAHDITQVNKKTHFCCEEHMHEYKKSLTKVIIDGESYDITKDLIIQEAKKYKSISKMADCLSVSRFLLARRIKEYKLNCEDIFKH